MVGAMNTNTTIRVGFARRDVTPPLSKRDTTPLLGFVWERAKRWDYAHDPLAARAMWAESAAGAVAVVSVDMIGDAVGFGDCARQRIEREFGLAPARVMVACTHAHATPETIALSGFEIDREWLDSLAGNIARAVAEAKGNARPATLHTAAAPLDGVTLNRRAPVVERYLRDGGELSEADRARATDVDRELRALWALDHDGRVLGAVVNYAVHAVSVQTRPYLSADIPGHAMAALESMLGGDATCLFLQGATGDINPQCDRTLAGGQQAGGRIADAALELVRANGDIIQPSPMGGRTQKLLLPRKATRPPGELLAELRRMERDAMAGGPPVPRLLKEEAALAQRPAQIEAEVQVLSIGPLRIAGVPGELFCCLGRDIKEAGSGAPVMVAAYTNGYLGYLYPRAAHEIGGYEPSRGRWSPLATGGGEAIRDAAVELLFP